MVFWHFLRPHWGLEDGAGWWPSPVPAGRDYTALEERARQPRLLVAGCGARPVREASPRSSPVCTQRHQPVWAGRDSAMLITARWADEDQPAGAGPTGREALAGRTLLSEPALGTPGRLCSLGVAAVNPGATLSPPLVTGPPPSGPTCIPGVTPTPTPARPAACCLREGLNECDVCPCSLGRRASFSLSITWAFMEVCSVCVLGTGGGHRCPRPCAAGSAEPGGRQDHKHPGYWGDCAPVGLCAQVGRGVGWG